MKSFYESFRESPELLITTPDESFSPHYHINVEIYLIKNNAYQMSINDQAFLIDDGSIVIADSYDVHGYQGIKGNVDKDSRIIIIPYEYLSYFNSIKRERKIKTPHFKNKQLCEKLIKFIDEHIKNAINDDTLSRAIDYFFSLLLEEIEFEKVIGFDSAKLIKNVLSYIHQNYTDNITRNSIAKKFGYSAEHISRVFHKFLKTSISTYINDLRYEYVEKNKNTSDKTLLTLIFEAGFNSQRTYYRVKTSYKKGK